LINFNLKLILIFLGGYLCSDIIFFLNKSLKASSVDDLGLIEIMPKSNNSKYEVSNFSSNFDQKNYEFLNQFKNDLDKSETRFFGIFGISEEISYKNEALDIESNIQSQEGDIFTAEGDVKMRLNNSILIADKITYHKINKSFFAEGNITFYRGNQYLEASKFLYNLESKDGFIVDVYGVIDLENFENDLDLVDDTDLKKNENNVYDPKLVDQSTISLVNNFETNKKFNLTELKLKIPSVTKWRFSAKRINIESDVLKSNNILFTNDIYNKPQFLLQSKNFSGEILNSKLRLISGNSWVILDNKFKFPLGRRKIYDRDPLTKWGFGSDYKEKEGIFISRGSDNIRINENYELRLTPTYLIQRSLKGNTKSFRSKDTSILSSKVENNNKFSDLFALDADIFGSIYSWDLSLFTSFNSLNLDRLSESARAKLILSKSINLEELKNQENKSLISNKLNFKFYSAYRERVYRGFSGEDEIYNGNGLTISQNKYWDKNDVKRSLGITYDIGKFKAKSSRENIFENQSRNVFAVNYDYIFPLWKKKDLDKKINNLYKYSPEVIEQGVFWNSSFKTGLFLYGEGDNQQIANLTMGPLITLGSFTKSFFDYTLLNVEGIYVLKSGQSPFAFDNVNDKPRIRITAKQQIYGALVANFETYLNMDSQASDYGDLTNTKYGLDFKRRAYSIGTFYDTSNDAFGLQFNINNFNYSGNSKRF